MCIGARPESSQDITKVVGRVLDSKARKIWGWENKCWREEECDRMREQLLQCFYPSLLGSTSLDTFRLKTTWRRMATFRHWSACRYRWRDIQEVEGVVCVPVRSSRCGQRWMLNLKSLEDEQGFSWQLRPPGFACHSLSLGFRDNETRDKDLRLLVLTPTNISPFPSLALFLAAFTLWSEKNVTV